MWDSASYELLDFGNGRKLERWGRQVVDRPAPAAAGRRAKPSLWSAATLKFARAQSGQEGQWTTTASSLPQWTVQWGRHLTFELQCGSHGQVGVFPEQSPNWQWLIERVEAFNRSVSILNLFAYTGGATLAAASAGANVTHVDSANSVVKRARRNAELSSLDDAPIRWIVDDALEFVQRELRRGRRYDGVVLDPPTYGHGRKRKAWRLERDLPELIKCCWDLTGRDPTCWLLSCHVSDWGARDLAGWLRRHTDLPLGKAASVVQLTLQSRDGRPLRSGVAMRYERG